MSSAARVPGDLSVRSTQTDVIVPPYFSLFFQFLQDMWYAGALGRWDAAAPPSLPREGALAPHKRASPNLIPSPIRGRRVAGRVDDDGAARGRGATRRRGRGARKGRARTQMDRGRSRGSLGGGRGVRPRGAAKGRPRSGLRFPFLRRGAPLARLLRPPPPPATALASPPRRSPENPNGKILLAIAENKLQLPRLIARLDASPAPTPTDYGYGDRAGLLELREAVAGVLTKYFLDDGEEVTPAGGGDEGAGDTSADPLALSRSRVHASELIVHNGVTSCIEAAFWALADDGDAVLLPTPYYPAFERDVAGRFGARLVGIPAIDEAGDVEAQLEAALADATRALVERAAAAGTPPARAPRVAALLIANPGNPTGHVYSHETVAALVRWAARNRVHLVSDEIYGLSVHDLSDPVFRSSAVRVARDLVAAGDVAEADAARYVHAFWGLSKDFGVSGARVGFVWSRSPELHRALKSSSLFYGVGGAAQRRYADLLADRAFVDAYVADNRRLLRKSYDDAVAKLHAVGAQTSGARGSMFIWADLGPWVRAHAKANAATAQPAAPLELTQAQREAVDKVFQLGRPTEVVDAEADEEIAFWTDLTLATGVLLTPGASCRSPLPGFVRFCFAWVPYEVLMLAVDRIVAYLETQPRA